MSARRRPSRTRASGTTASDLHRAWLELVDTDGPFLSVPALKRIWPQGMPQADADARAAMVAAKAAFERAWEAWDSTREDQGKLDDYRKARDAWVELVLRDFLGWGELYVADLTTPTLADAARGVRSPNHLVTVLPSGALVRGDLVGALLLVVDPVDSLRDPLGDGWATSPIDRMEELLRASGVPIGVVTDGRWWGIVSAQADALMASGIVDSHTWVEERAVSAAFVELLQRRWLVGGAEAERLTAVFKGSVAAAEDITEALGVQVRRAVELLVSGFSEAALDARAAGEPDPLPADPADVYGAAVTVMMRVVFLLFAEERGLLPASRLFTAAYGMSQELDRLDQRARDEGSEALDATSLTWHRLLATSAALCHGASFEDLRLPAYGGSLFDPEQYPYLRARTRDGRLAVAVSDRVMAEVLRAVQVAQLRGEPARRISFRNIDVEQIGYIYEGLLGYSCARVGDVTVGLLGKAGTEPEIALVELEALAERHRGADGLTDALHQHVKATQPASELPSKATLAKALLRADAVEDADRALRAVSTDPALRDRLRPFVGVIRRDLRNRPHVVQPGGLTVVETPSRSTAGAHYTPRELAEEVVEHALMPLVFSPGPHQTPAVDAWRPLSSEDILDLKVADIACGSGAFLVAAARFLAARLVEAWQREGTAVERPHELELKALRAVVANCLYGADINGLALEMCKLSLWLVSLDPKLAFSFVDDKMLHGNSLLGLTDLRQLERLHIHPDRAATQYGLFDLDVDGVLTQVVRLRQRLADEVGGEDDPQRSATAKRRLLERTHELSRQLVDVADGVLAAGLRLGGAPGGRLDEAYKDLRLAVADAYPADGSDGNRRALDAILERGLTPTVDTDYERWQPLHWVLEVPDVMARGGFDAVVGNPPFLGGQKLTGTSGVGVRDWLVNVLAGGQRGSADLVAYFLLRAGSLIKLNGTLGLIATNTLAQGDTREVGLDRLVLDGLTITRAIQSRSWPTAYVNLEYAAVWATRGAVASEIERVSDGVPVAAISTLLEPAGQVHGPPVRLVENQGIAFQGCIVLGKGFVLEPEEAQAWIAEDPRNREVLFPYLNGEDLNSRPDTSPSRWVIDFFPRPEREVTKYRQPFHRVQATVKSERASKPAAVRKSSWWLFLRARGEMRKAIAGLDEVLVIALVSKTVMPVRVPTGQVFSHKLAVFAADTFTDQAVLSSSMHQLWAVKYGSTMRADVNYSPTDVFLTLPRPAPTDRLAYVGKTLDVERREIMLRRRLGLTKLYNLVNDQDVGDGDADVARLRQIHVELDEAVLASYGWSNLPLDHGFHTYRQMQRWTLSPAARVEVLDRLLEENHRRAAAQGGASPPDETADEIDEEVLA